MSHPHQHRILALGSPHGDDRVGWRVAELLEADPELAGCVCRLASPWEIVEHAAADVHLVLVDACRSGQAPGNVQRIELVRASHPVAGCVEPHTAREQAVTRLLDARPTTHGGGVCEALQLAESLGRSPASVVVFAIEVERCDPAAELSGSARAAAIHAAALIKQEAV